MRKNHTVNGIHIEVKKAMEKDQMGGGGGGGRGGRGGAMSGGRGLCFDLSFVCLSVCPVAAVVVVAEDVVCIRRPWFVLFHVRCQLWPQLKHLAKLFCVAHVRVYLRVDEVS